MKRGGHCEHLTGPEAAAQVRAHVEVVADALHPWTAEQTYINFPDPAGGRMMSADEIAS